MATATWRTCQEHDEMRPPKFHPNWSIGRRVIAFPLFCNMAAVRHFEFKKNLIFNYVTVVMVLTCCCVPNFIKIGSRVQPPDAHNCRMFNAATAVAMATESWGTCQGHDGMWPPKLGLSRSIGRRIMAFLIFSDMAAVRHFEFLKIFYIWSRDCHYGPNLLLCTKFHKNWFTRSAFRRP